MSQVRMNRDLTREDKWVVRFMRLAVEVSSWSKDPERAVGAVLVTRDGRQFSAGYNGLPWSLPDPDFAGPLPGLSDVAGVEVEGFKNRLTVHAEVNALLNAPFDAAGCSLFTTAMPCADCALVIVQSRISSVYYWQDTDARSKWADSWKLAQQLFRGAGIVVKQVWTDAL